MRCVTCGHTYHGMQRVQFCSLCDGQDWNCGKCRPGRAGSGSFSDRWFCRACWADWFNEQAPAYLVTLHVSNIDGDSTVTCYNIAGDQILSVTGDLTNEGLEHIKMRLEQRLLKLAPERRLARDCRAYEELEFRRYYGEDTYEEIWHQSPVVRNAKLSLISPDGKQML